MINAIGEAAVQQNLRANHNLTITDKDMAEQRVEQLRKERPVEKADESRNQGMNPGHDENNTTSRQQIEDGRIVLEKYDENGRLVEKIPPGYLPFEEIV